MPFEDNAHRTSYNRSFLPTVEVKFYSVINDGKNFLDQPVNHNLRTYENIRKIATGQGHDYTTGCLLDYPYFKKYYKLITIDLSKQQAHDADPRETQQINIIGNLEQGGITTMFFIIEEAKETIFDF